MAGMLAGTCGMGAAAAETTEAEAKEIALKDAGLAESDVIFDRVEKGTEQGASVYEIEFRTSAKEYDYDIAVADGEIVKESWELCRPSAGGKILNASGTAKVPASVAAAEKAKAGAKTARTGREAAIDAALSHAGFSANEVSGLKCEKDYDDGREIYEVEFKKNGYEYSYDIDAKNYSVIEWDKDYDD